MGFWKELWNDGSEKKEKPKTIFDSKFNTLAEARKFLKIQKEVDEPAFLFDLNSEEDIQVLARDKRWNKNSNYASGSSIVWGGSGSGKSQSIIIPTILRNKNLSMCVTDPKLELFNKTYEKKHNQGYNVFLFNPDSIDESDKWNPLEIIYTNFKEFIRTQDIKILDFIDKKITFIADTICPIPEVQNANSFFDISANKIFRGVIYMFLELALVGKENFNIPDIINIISTKYNLEQIVKLHQSDLLVLSAKYLSSLNMNSESQSVWSTMMSNLNPFMSNSIRSATSKNTIDIEKFTESKSIIYVKIDTTIKQSAINKLAILLMYEIYNNSRNYLIKHHIEALPTPLAFVTDEFGNIPKISFIPKIFSLNRSENIFALLVLQSFSQIKENYGEYVTQELLDSTQAHFILGLQDVEFANKLSKLCGRDVRKIESISKSKGKEGEKDNKSTSVSEQLIDTIKPEDFIKKDADEIIVMCQNNIPLKTKFVPVWKRGHSKKL